MYIPKDRYLWDFWLIQHGGVYHLFHLQAPRDIPDPELRHGLAMVGHAVSRDLRSWREVGVALQPGRPGEWDDRAIWTGSVVEKEGLFYMYYTGTNRSEGGRIQRVGLATSRDLVHWTKHQDNPVLEADPTWYELDPQESPFGELAWRDPYVVELGGEFYAFITARLKRGPRAWRGCIGTARSVDLLHWEVGPPLETPAWFSQMEIPQLVELGGRYCLLFSAEAQWIEGDVPRVTGTFYAVSPGALGPYSAPRVLIGDEKGSFYGAKLVRTPGESWACLAWLRADPTGAFVGGLSDPLPVRIKDDEIVVCRRS